MKEFHEWAEEAYKTELVLVAEDGWNARQPEIDELKATIVKYDAGLRKNKANKHKLLSKNIELQKRIDAALDELENPIYSEERVIHEVIKILKGSQND